LKINSATGKDSKPVSVRAKAKRQYGNIMYIIGAIVAFGVGGTIAFIGNSSQNPFLIALGFCGLLGGVLLFVAWRRAGDEVIMGTSEVKDGRGQIVNYAPNSLNIFPDKIEFAYVEEPKGLSQKCLNDGKPYFVNIGNAENDELRTFSLPDDDEKERYYDPGEFANPVTMPSNKKYFTWSASTMQKISVGIMAVVIAAEIFGLIALGG